MAEEYDESSSQLERLAAVLVVYQQAKEAGQDPDRQELLYRYPDLRDELLSFFEDEDNLAPRLKPLREATRLSLPPTIDATALPHYEVGTCIGSGGMGAVFLARDKRLDRTVAIKVPLGSSEDWRHLKARFLGEAQIAGYLQSPGVVPVYEFGELSDGRPYFAMKHVQGQNLADLLSGRKDPTQDRDRFLDIFQQLCRTLAHAHDRGIVHRDLKPTNVLIEERDEVLVGDWGLATVLTDVSRGSTGEAADERPTVSGLTHLGDVFGTFSYMPPEQANGKVREIDQRADVFALGGILCKILTNEPPYSGGTAKEVKRLATSADLRGAEERLDACGASRELVELAKACLASDVQTRPRNAGQVAARYEEYKKGREREREEQRLKEAAAQTRAEEAEARALIERARAEEALHRAAAERRAWRRTVFGLATTAVAVLGGVAVTLGFKADRDARAAKTEQAIKSATDEAHRLLSQARSSTPGDLSRYQEAFQAARKAHEWAQGGTASEEDRQQAKALLDSFEAELATAEKDGRLLAQLLDVVEPKEHPRYVSGDSGSILQLAEPDADTRFGQAFRDYGLDLDTVPRMNVVTWFKNRPPAVVAEVVAALDEWAFLRRRSGRSEDAWRQLADLANAIDDDGRRGELRAILGRSGLGSVRDRERLRELARQADPATEPILSIRLLARAMQVTGDDAAAIELLWASVRARPREVLLHYALGQLLELQHPSRWAEAVACYSAARALRPQLGMRLASALAHSGSSPQAVDLLRLLIRSQPDNPWMHLTLGNSLREQGQLEEAIQEYRIAITLDPKDALPHINLGAMLVEKKQLDEGIQELRTAIVLDPKRPKARLNLGVALHDTGQLEEAIREHRTAIALDPKLAEAHTGLGNALRASGQLEEAIREFRIAIGLEANCAKYHSNLGSALRAKGDLDEAIKEYSAAIALDPKLPGVHYNLGNVLYDTGQLEEAIREHRTAIALDPKLAEAHTSLGNALRASGQLEEAIREHRTAIALDPKLARAHCGLGNALRASGQLEEAIKECRIAIALDPNNAKAHNALGVALEVSGQIEEAIQEYRIAIALDPNDAQTHANFGNALGATGQLEEAIKECRAAIALDPKLASSHGILAQVFLHMGRFAEAQAATRRSLDLLPQNHRLRPLVTRQLQRCNRLLALDQKLSAFLEGKAEPADDAERLALAHLCQEPFKKLYAASARFYAAALASDAKLADDLRSGHRYNAARAAALAGCGQGNDADKLDDKERARLRKQVLDWLRADLALWTRHAASDKPADRKLVQTKLKHWQGDADLVGLRDKNAVPKLPADEQAAYQQLWADVQKVLERAEGK